MTENTKAEIALLAKRCERMKGGGNTGVVIFRVPKRREVGYE